MNDRKIIPFNTGRVKIGSSYIPQPKLTDAFWLERQTAKRSPLLRWVMWSAFALAALVLISSRA